MKPNLFIIGAAKSGTTSLHAYLAQHPEIFMSDPKEPGFFVPEITYYPKDEAWYLGLFEEAGEARVVGESSTHYSKLPTYRGVAERVRAFAPDARLIYLMRDPIDRAVSHYWHNARQFEEARPLGEALERDVQYRAYGDYAMQLAPWFERFGRDRVLTLVFEEMVADPSGTLDLVFRWLGLDPAPGEIELEARNTRPGEVVKARGRGIVNRLRYSSLWSAVSPRVPQALKDRAKKLALERVRPADVGTDDAVRLLRPWARTKIGELEQVLGRTFDPWTTSLGD